MMSLEISADSFLVKGTWWILRQLEAAINCRPWYKGELGLKEKHEEICSHEYKQLFIENTRDCKIYFISNCLNESKDIDNLIWYWRE